MLVTAGLLPDPVSEVPHTAHYELEASHWPWT